MRKILYSSNLLVTFCAIIFLKRQNNWTNQTCTREHHKTPSVHLVIGLNKRAALLTTFGYMCLLFLNLLRSGTDKLARSKVLLTNLSAVIPRPPGLDPETLPLPRTSTQSGGSHDSWFPSMRRGAKGPQSPCGRHVGSRRSVTKVAFLACSNYVRTGCGECRSLGRKLYNTSWQEYGRRRRRSWGRTRGWMTKAGILSLLLLLLLLLLSSRLLLLWYCRSAREEGCKVPLKHHNQMIIYVGGKS